MDLHLSKSAKVTNANSNLDTARQFPVSEPPTITLPILKLHMSIIRRKWIYQYTYVVYEGVVIDSGSD